jgi:hypothetical protein
MIFGSCSAKMPFEYAGPSWPRPAPRAQIIAERLWAGAVASSQDVLERVGCAYWDLPPPPAPSPPPAPGGIFSPVPGACRDPQGEYGNRLDSNEGNPHGLKFSVCVQQCMRLGMKCDAYDINGELPAPGTDPVIGWCGIWGEHLTEADEDLAAGFKFYASSGGRVCRGDIQAGTGNKCFRRPPFCNASATR